MYAGEWHAIDTSPQQDVAEKPVNSKKFVGVWYHMGPGTFEAVLEHNGQELSGGQYETAEEAAAAHDTLARMYRGCHRRHQLRHQQRVRGMGAPRHHA